MSDQHPDDPTHRGTTDLDDRLARLFEVALFAPVGLATYLREVGPPTVSMFVARGRAEVDRRQEQVGRQLRHARGMGEVALAFGLPQLRKQAEQRLDALRRRAEEALPLHLVGPEAGERGSGPGDAVVAEPVDDDGAAPPAEDALAARREQRAGLAIPGYDALSASQVVERLAGLESEELEAVRDYERNHRNRRTVLGKLDQLR